VVVDEPLDLGFGFDGVPQIERAARLQAVEKLRERPQFAFELALRRALELAHHQRPPPRPDATRIGFDWCILKVEGPIPISVLSARRCRMRIAIRIIVVVYR